MKSEFYRKLWKDIWPVKDLNWINTWYYYVIDSKLRTKKRLDLFILEPLLSPQEPLINLGLKYPWNGKNEKEIVLRHSKYVYQRVKYTTYENGRKELWKDPYDTWLSQEDDCDGKNNLTHHLCRLSGIPQFLLWNVIGEVYDPGLDKAVGHYWLLFLDRHTGNLYEIDTTYYPDFSSIDTRIPFKLSPGRYRKIWFIWNEDIIMKPRT